MKKGTITLARNWIDPASSIDERWLLAQLYECRDAARAKGLSLARATLYAFTHYQYDLKRLMPEAFRRGEKVIAIVSGFGEMNSPTVKNTINPKGQIIT